MKHNIDALAGILGDEVSPRGTPESLISIFDQVLERVKLLILHFEVFERESTWIVMRMGAKTKIRFLHTLLVT